MKTMRKLAAGLLAAAMLAACFAFPASAAGHPFTDVPNNVWYTGNVQYVYENGLMAGTAADKFSPNTKMNRAMLAAVLYRMDGSKAVTGSMPFTDIRTGAYYYTALLWAYQNGIIAGTEPDKFSPEMAVTREMMVTIFYRYAVYKGFDVSRGADLGKYTDAGKISAYARVPFQWSVQEGIIMGMTPTTLSPKGTATRAECAAVLQRFCGLENTPVEPPANPPLIPGDPVSLMGKDTASFLSGGILYVRAEDFAQAFGIALTVVDGKIFLDGGQLSPAGLSRADENYVPVLAVAQSLGYGVFVDSGKDGRTYVYTTSGIDIPEGITVPVLMYHSVTDNIWGSKEYQVSPSSLEAQLKYLVENGYDPIFVSDLAHVEDYDKPVILTFDDGYDDNYQEVYPLLQKYKVKATMFVIADSIGGTHKMTADQLLEMSQSGLVSVQSHTATHKDLSKLTEAQIVAELERSQLTVTRITGIKPDVLCYPYGCYSGLAKEVASRYYSYAMVIRPSGYVTGNDRYVVGRYFVARSTTIDEFAGMVAGAGKRQ